MKSISKQGLHGILPLLILSVFALCVLAVLLFGAENYKELSQRDDLSYTQRTAVGYIGGKIRQVSDKSLISIERFGDGDCLCLPSNYENENYITRLYCHNGNLCELFTPVDISLDADSGEIILPVENIGLSIDGSLLKITISHSNGESAPLYFDLEGGAAK